MAGRLLTPLLRSVVPAALVGLALCACGEGAGTPPEPAARAGGIAIFEPRAPAPAGDVAAVYFTVADTAGAGDRLLGASCAFARHVMLHETRDEGGLARMTAAEGGIEIPAGGRLVLEPGGRHVMLMGLERRPAPGESFELELRFERAGSVRLPVPVIEYAALEHVHRSPAR